jgi:rubrerythrin
MNIFNLIESLDSKQISHEDLDALAIRRDVFRKLGDFGKKMALGTLSLGAVTVATSQKAMAQGSTGSLTDILNFALLLEHLEAEFYVKGLDSGLIPKGKTEMIFMQIAKHEAQHVEFLKKTIGALGGSPIEKPTFDFTAKGMFKPFQNYGQFLSLSQAFEDTGVRAYKGQAANVMSNDDVLTAALQIHSVEARHAARVRRLRGVQSWYMRTARDKNVAAVYAGEDNVMQGGVDLTTVTQISRLDIMESFDEPLTKEEVTAIAALFIA